MILVSFISVAGLFGIGSLAINGEAKENEVVEKAEAATANVNNIRLFLADKQTWFSRDAYGGGGQPYAHIWSISISSDADFASTKAAIEQAGGSYNDSDGSADFGMIHKSGSDGQEKQWQLNLPWYITGFTYKFKSTYNNWWTSGEASVTAPCDGDGTNIWGDASGNTSCYYQSTSSHTISTTTYTLTFYPNGGSSISGSPFTLKEYQKTVKPTDPTKNGYTFWKWTNGDSYGGDSFTFGSRLTGNVDLYAQWTPTNPTIYFVNGFSSGTPTIHYWGGVGSGTTWPGNAMQATSAKIYCSKSGSWSLMTIYKYSISGSPAYLQINRGNDGEKTGDLTITNGGIYWFGPDASTFTSVASYLINFEGSMGSYTYDGKSYSNSICNLGGSASTLVSSYNTLVSSGGDVATSITNSKINTYSTPVTSPSSKSDIAMPTLIAQINKNTTNGVQQIFSPLNLFGAEEDMSTIIVIVASSVALLSITALGILVIKKRKREQE